MVTGLAREAQEREDLPVIVLDRYGTPRWQPIWNGNPRIIGHARMDKPLHRLTNGPGARPYIAQKTSKQWTWRAWHEGGPPRGEIYLTEAEQTFGRLNSGRLILEPHTKNKASPNKSWGWVRWNKLAWLLQEKYGERVTQVGPAGAQVLAGADFIQTDDFRLAAAVLSTARACVVPEGGLHHAAAAFKTPTVVVRGAFIAPEVTGYGDQVEFWTGEGLGCGMRTPCTHCRDAMAQIRPEEVAERLMEVMLEASARLAPA